MTFLNPAFLFGLFAALIPVVLHFLNLRKLKKIEFSTLKFLKELQKTKIRRIKLKQWLLLFLRVLIILFLVLAFARPTLKEITFGSSSAAKTSSVLIIDNTFSMSVVTEKGSYLNYAKTIAKNLLAGFKPGDDLVIIPLAELKHKTFEVTKNFSKAKKQIEEIEISDVSPTLNEALISAAQILYQSKNYNKEVYLLTDFQKSRIFNSGKELSNFGSTFTPNARFYLFNFAEKNFPNLGITSFKPENQIFEIGKTISFTTTVKNFSDESISNNVVSLFINGKRSAQQNISLTAKEQKSITFETTLNDSGFVNFMAELEDDALLNDNMRYFALNIPKNISLLILADNFEDNKFLKLALGSSNNSIKITESSLSQIASQNLNNYNLVVIIGNEKLKSTQPLKAYANNGGNIILMPGSQSKFANFKLLCRNFDLNASSEVGKINSAESITQFGKVEFNHPLLKNIFNESRKTEIESPNIYRYIKISNTGKEKNIISFIDGSPFLLESFYGKGKILTITSPPILSWNDFSLKSFFAPLINKMVYYSSIKIKDNFAQIAGEDAIVDLSQSTGSQIIIYKPQGKTEYINTDTLLNKSSFIFKQTNYTGIYKYFSNNRLLDFTYVNTDERESDTQILSNDDFEKYLTAINYKGKSFFLSPNQNFRNIIYQSRFGMELWKHFIIIALFLAIAESLIARDSKKDISTITEK